MSRKTKTLIISLVILILLGGGYYGATVWQKKKAASASSPYTPPQRLGNFENYDLAKIEVPGLALEKNGETWELSYLEGGISPDRIELDQRQIQLLTYSLTSVWIDRIVDEEPEDLSVYGLETPSSWLAITDSTGSREEYILGDLTPSRTSYYAMEEGSPAVYAVSVYQGDNMRFTLDRIRQRSLFPAFEPQTLSRLRLEFPETVIDISPKPESIQHHLSTFSTHVMASPYKLTRGVDSEAFYNLLMPLSGLTIAEFIDDLPSSLQPYGLDKPARIFIDTAEGSVDLLVGDQVDGKRYAKLADTQGSPRENSQGVFTVDGLEPLINVRPFSLVDKFSLLINIDDVDHLSVTGGERNLSVDFQGKGDEGVYFLNGKKAETRSFKNFYQAVIGLLADAEYTGPARQSEDTGEVTIEYRLNSPAGGRPSITLVPYNRDFYAVRQEGAMEFLISRNQVRRIYETADAVVYE